MWGGGGGGEWVGVCVDVGVCVFVCLSVSARVMAAIKKIHTNHDSLSHAKANNKKPGYKDKMGRISIF